MSVVTTLALALVVLAGLYLLGLAATGLLSPLKAKAFLSSMASSALAHYVELVVRSALGVAFILYAPHMRFAGVFLLFGWVLIVTTVCLLAVPWQWHRRFASWSVPQATRHMPLLALGSLACGAFVLMSVFLASGHVD